MLSVRKTQGMIGANIQIGAAILAQDWLDDQIFTVLGKTEADIPPLPFGGSHIVGGQPANNLSAKTHFFIYIFLSNSVF